MFSRAGSVSNQIVVIEDHSIAVILALSALMVLTGLTLIWALTGYGRHDAHPVQSQIIRSRMKTEQKLTKSSPVVSTKPETSPLVTTTAQSVKAAPPAAAVTLSSERPKETAAPEVPETRKAKTVPAALPPAGIPAIVKGRTPVTAAEGSRNAANVLTMMRGGRHPEYASIVFEASGKIIYDTPRIIDCAIRFRLFNTRTRLSSFRLYKTFDSWVRLEKNGPDLDVTIGLLPGLIKYSAFLMEAPPRLVVNLYDRKAFR